MSVSVGSIGYREVCPGDVVHDDTDARSYAITKVTSGEIYLDNPDSKDDILVVPQEDELLSKEKWIMRDFPDHIISFREAPGKTYTNSLSISETTYSKFLLIISSNVGPPTSSAVFDTGEEAVEYFASMMRLILESKESPYRDKYYEGFDKILFDALSSGFDLSEDPSFSPGEISSLIISYTEELERDGYNLIENFDEQTRYHITIIEIPYFTISPMIKSSTKQ